MGVMSTSVLLSSLHVLEKEKNYDPLCLSPLTLHPEK